MRVLKVFNNNSVAAMSDEMGDIILTGSGIGFQKKIGDTIDERRIEKTYRFQDIQRKRFEQALNNVPTIFEITDEIVKLATERLNTEFSGEIFLAISDHISFAIKRKKENMKLPNIVLSETKYLYRKEYEIGLFAIDLIEEKTGVRLDDDEASFVALHLINFSLDRTNHNATKIATLTTEVVDIMKSTLKLQLDEESSGYIRIITHLKYLAERIFKNEPMSVEDTTSSIREMLKEDLRLALCINRIVKLIHKRYDYLLSPDEQTYLCIHIKRNLESA